MRVSRQSFIFLHSSFVIFCKVIPFYCQHSCCARINANMFPTRGPGFYSFVNFLSLLKQGEVNGIRVRLDRLQALISTSCVENLECSQLDNSLEQKLL